MASSILSVDQWVYGSPFQQSVTLSVDQWVTAPPFQQKVTLSVDLWRHSFQAEDFIPRIMMY